MSIRVECHAGFRGEQEPVALWLGERRLGIREIVDRWYSSSRRWLKVQADDGDVYILRHEEPNGEWELAAFTSAQSPGIGPSESHELVSKVD